MMGHDARGRIDRDRVDLLGRFVGHRLDVHPALGGDHEGDAARDAVDQHREVELFGDLGAFLDVEAVHLLAGRAGLDRHQRLTEHLAGVLLHLVDRLGDAHAALGALGRALEGALAAAARVDLALHDPDGAAEFLGGGFGLRRVEDGHAAGDGQAELLQHGLGLVFVDVHRDLVGRSE
jgi:hypothetical protein